MNSRSDNYSFLLVVILHIRLEFIMVVFITPLIDFEKVVLVLRKERLDFLHECSFEKLSHFSLGFHRLLVKLLALLILSVKLLFYY